MTRQMPRRLTPPEPPGSMLKRIGTLAAPRPSKRAESDNDPTYLAELRQMPCLCCGLQPCGEAAHVRMASAAFGKASGLGKKPADRWALPVCAVEHRIAKEAQHNRNEAAFWESYDISPLVVAVDLYAARGDLVAMENVVRIAIMKRRR